MAVAAVGYSARCQHGKCTRPLGAQCDHREWHLSEAWAPHLQLLAGGDGLQVARPSGMGIAPVMNQVTLQWRAPGSLLAGHVPQAVEEFRCLPSYCRRLQLPMSWGCASTMSGGASEALTGSTTHLTISQRRLQAKAEATTMTVLWSGSFERMRRASLATCSPPHLRLHRTSGQIRSGTPRKSLASGRMWPPQEWFESKGQEQER